MYACLITYLGEQGQTFSTRENVWPIARLDKSLRIICDWLYRKVCTFSYELIVRTSNHVLYVSNVSRLARPDIFLLARK